MQCVECVVCSVQFSLYIEHNVVFSGHPQCYSNIEDGQGKGCAEGLLSTEETRKVRIIWKNYLVSLFTS